MSTWGTFGRRRHNVLHVMVCRAANGIHTALGTFVLIRSWLFGDAFDPSRVSAPQTITELHFTPSKARITLNCLSNSIPAHYEEQAAAAVSSQCLKTWTVQQCYYLLSGAPSVVSATLVGGRTLRWPTFHRDSSSTSLLGGSKASQRLTLVGLLLLPPLPWHSTRFDASNSSPAVSSNDSASKFQARNRSRLQLSDGKRVNRACIRGFENDLYSSADSALEQAQQAVQSKFGNCGKSMSTSEEVESILVIGVVLCDFMFVQRAAARREIAVVFETPRYWPGRLKRQACFLAIAGALRHCLKEFCEVPGIVLCDKDPVLDGPSSNADVVVASNEDMASLSIADTGTFERRHGVGSDDVLRRVDYDPVVATLGQRMLARSSEVLRSSPRSTLKFPLPHSPIVSDVRPPRQSCHLMRALIARWRSCRGCIGQSSKAEVTIDDMTHGMHVFAQAIWAQANQRWRFLACDKCLSCLSAETVIYLSCALAIISSFSYSPPMTSRKPAPGRDASRPFESGQLRAIEESNICIVLVLGNKGDPDPMLNDYVVLISVDKEAVGNVLLLSRKYLHSLRSSSRKSNACIIPISGDKEDPDDVVVLSRRYLHGLMGAGGKSNDCVVLIQSTRKL
ncbi:uncharacterized protein MYCFIDRAFT_176858 [Pseudocercospora fijiensis CIRAD86]|uniref:Uncharacterized protein n=1 Tax=Pseudocercospora fijiensis (strain CIRAD86) TaxID=383855 RepID=M3ARX8_PSEFD|nr:uncharacterized protein MYCFIDRAFT_176858 [Pseudocercospora fijiensis CIRAD86]EME79853.1 hypothetical protein MYCFIDRAFT_176858 [Pseudocercospora fijiensis CIRAD86]